MYAESCQHDFSVTLCQLLLAYTHSSGAHNIVFAVTVHPCSIDWDCVASGFCKLSQHHALAFDNCLHASSLKRWAAIWTDDVQMGFQSMLLALLHWYSGAPGPQTCARLPPPSLDGKSSMLYGFTIVVSIQSLVIASGRSLVPLFQSSMAIPEHWCHL
jgi:hypothetical protein